MTSVPTSFVGTRTPWHGVGTVLPQGTMSMHDALELGGLNFTVDVEPFQVRDKAVPNKRAVVRNDTDDVLGIVGKDWQAVQPEDALGFLDSILTDGGLLDEAGLEYETAGAFGKGEKIFVVAALREATFTVADGDTHDLYLTLSTGFDGKTRTAMSVSTVRAECANLLALALGSRARQRWSLTHRTSLADRQAEATQALNLTYKYKEALIASFEELLDTQVTTDQFAALVEGVLPDAKKKEATIEELVEIWKNESSQPDGANAYSALNAWTYFGSNVKTFRTEEAKFMSLSGFSTVAAQNFAGQTQDFYSGLLELAR